MRLFLTYFLGFGLGRTIANVGITRFVGHDHGHVGHSNDHNDIDYHILFGRDFADCDLHERSFECCHDATARGRA